MLILKNFLPNSEVEIIYLNEYDIPIRIDTIDLVELEKLLNF